ncbi:MAG: O-antigen ligase family protein, partial [Candidatus Omnitrophota bacterium]
MLVILLSLIFIRPFICSLAFPHLNFIYSIALLVFLLAWFSRNSVPRERIESLKFPLILFFLALLASIVFSADRINSLKEVYKHVGGVLIFLTAVSLTHEARIRVIKTIVLAGFFVSLLAIYQYLFGFRHILDYLAENNVSSVFALDYISRKRVFFPFVTPNSLGGYLAMIIPLILASWNKKKNIFFSPLFFLLLSTSYAVLLTKSLGALLSLSLGLIIYFSFPFALNNGYPARHKMLNKKIMLLAAGFLIIIGAVFLMRQTATKQHILPTFSLVMRINYWFDTLKIIKANLWTGVGPGNFNLTFARYAHNSYLQIWAEMGILGAVSFLWLIIAALNSAFKAIKKSSDRKLIIGLVAANSVFLIHNLMDFSFFLPEISLIWWVIL